LEDNPLDIENIKEKQLEDNDLQQSVIRHPELGAALEKSLRKKYFQNHFFLNAILYGRYGVSYEYSSRQILKKIILSCVKCVFYRFFSCFTS
jgi:hypothetical protein